MNFIKKHVLMSAFLLSLLTTPCITICDNGDEGFEAYFNGLATDTGLDEIALPSTTKQFDPEKIIQILLDMGIVDILKENLFLRTNPLNKRNILDQPMGFLDRRYKHDDWVLGSNFFYNEMTRCYFSQHSDAITSYLGLTQDSFLDKLDAASKKVKDFDDKFSFDPLDALELFKNATISERQAGMLFWGQKQLTKWNVSWKLPFYYLERNYWLTEEEQQALEDEYGASQEDEKAYLQHNFLVADKIGFGDFRLAADTELFSNNDDRFNYRIGCQVTIPTAFEIANGIMGKQFKLQPRRQNLDLSDITGCSNTTGCSCQAERSCLKGCNGYHLDDIVNMALEEDGNKDKAFSILKDVGQCALNGINAQLLEAPLGNSGHLGVGIYTKSGMPVSLFIRQPWAYNFIYKGGMSLEYLVPKTEQRMFVKKINLDAFEAHDFENPDQALQNMIFLEEQIVDKFFPFVYNTMVHPGIVFHWTGVLAYESYHWIFNLGTDTWIRSPEAFGTIQAPEEILPQLKINTAKRLMGYQWKLLGGLGYKVQSQKHTWILSLDGDSSFSNSGIGNEYTISFNVEVDF